MKIALLVAGASLLMASPAAAQALWQNVEVGMTAEQVSALYPDARVRRDKIEVRDYRPLPNCPSTVVIHMKPTVDTIEVRGAGTLPGRSGCSTEIRDALMERYGRPADQALEDEGFLGYSAPTASYFWIHEGVAMRYQRRENQGLMNPSWVMEYIPASRIEAERERRRGVGL